MKIQQLGKAISILLLHDYSESMMHVDVDAFHAPSECHTLVAKGEARRARLARRRAEAIARAPVRVIWAQARSRGGMVMGGPKHALALARVYSNHYPF